MREPIWVILWVRLLGFRSQDDSMRYRVKNIVGRGKSN
jgi:hypothetical protein